MKLFERDDGLVDLYLNEKFYKAIAKEDALDLIIEADHDLNEPDSMKKWNRKSADALRPIFCCQ